MNSNSRILVQPDFTSISSGQPLTWPKISIVTVNFNQGSFLEETIQSVFNQDYPNLEYIVIDGGSTDNSLDIITKYAPRFAYHCSEPDQGHYDAVNKGFTHATGEIFAFLNSDDKYFPGALKIAGEIFAAHADVHWITSLLPVAADTAGHCIDVMRQPGYSYEAFLDGRYGGGEFRAQHFIQQESSFWRRSLWEAAGSRLRLEISHAADFDLWARFYEHAELCGVAALLGMFRLRAGQRSQDGVYDTQRVDVLRQTRTARAWRRRPWHQMIQHSGLVNVPKVGKRLRSAFGYQAKRMVRRHPDQSDAFWALDSYSFL